MVSVRSVGLPLAIGLALTLSSLLIRTPVMRDEDTAGGTTRSAYQWMAAPNDDVGEEEASEWIIPEHPLDRTRLSHSPCVRLAVLDARGRHVAGGAELLTTQTEPGSASASRAVGMTASPERWRQTRSSNRQRDVFH